MMSMFLTRDEVMDILRISSSTLQRYMKKQDEEKEGGIEYFKFRGRVLFNKDKLEEFVNHNSVVTS